MHEMNLQEAPFRMIKNKTKTIELRLYDEKRRKIKPGDTIEFNNDKTVEILVTKVIALHIYKDFKELYKHFNKIEIGYEENEIPNPNDMEQYYAKEKIEKYGVVGIELKLESVRK